MPTKKEEDVPTSPRFQPAPLKSSHTRTTDKRSSRRCLCDECRGVLEVLNEADEKGIYSTIARWGEFNNNVLIESNPILEPLLARKPLTCELYIQ
jgi:hypothetical protein